MAQPEPAQTRFQRLETLFHQALECPKATRVENLRQWCGNDAALLTELLEMLASDLAVDQLLASTQSQDPAPRNLERTASDPLLGRTLGGFHIERELGRGGMGVVYLGRRVIGGFTQHAAVKLIARHLSSGPAIGQFNLERDTLALLSHKNIAALLDAGITPDGTPFVAMEYIEGRNFNTVCDDLSLPLEDKLRLMIDLCDAVEYVHRNLILHRDLKPGNVMVTDQGVVKLLDFGTLKLMGPAALLPSDMTQAGMRPMTLRYASPEHIAAKPVSTASDVYSLGMVLYRILAGRLPQAIEAASLTEHIDQLRHARLELPSQRSRDVHHIPRHLRKDLDAIASKAIRYEPEMRYRSADALAADLRLCLQQRPVSARSGTLRYQAARFYRRNAAPTTAALAILLVLAAGLAIMRHEAHRATTEHQRAEAGIEDERKLAHLLLFDYFEDLRDIPGSTEAQRQAATQAIAYLDGLNRVTNTPELQLDIVQAYRRLGLLLGSPYEANLGDAPTAVATLQKALPITQQLLHREPRNLAYRVASIGIHTALAQAYFSLEKPEAALAELLPATAMAREVAQDPNADKRALVQCAAAFKTLADTYGYHSNAVTADVDKDTAALQQSGAIYKSAGMVQGFTIVQMDLGILLEDVDVDRAIAVYKNAFATIDALPPSQRSVIGMVRLQETLSTKLGRIYLYQGHRSEADALLQPIHAIELRAIAADPIDTRARDDLIALDSSALDPLLALHDKTSIDVAQEYLQTARFLTKMHPENPSWRFNELDALLKSAKVYADLNGPASAAPLLAAGLPQLIASAQRRDADGDTLAAATQALLWFPSDPLSTPALTIEIAQRAVASTHPAAVDRVLLLAQAQRAGGLYAASANTARVALGMLAAHPNSLRNAAYTAQAKDLLRPPK